MLRLHLSWLSCLICLSLIIEATVSLVKLSHRMLSLALFFFFFFYVCVWRGGEGRGGPTYDNGLVYLHMHAHYVGNIIVQNYMVINTDSESSLVLDIWLVMVFREPLSFIFMDLDRNKVLGFQRWYKPTDGKLLPWSAKWKWWGWMLECSAGLGWTTGFLICRSLQPYLWLHCNGVSIVLE